MSLRRRYDVLLPGGRNLNVSLVFMRQLHYAVRKNIRLNSAHYFIMKISHKRELQQIAFNHSSDIDFQDFMNLYEKYTEKPYSFLVIDTTLNVSTILNVSERAF